MRYRGCNNFLEGTGARHSQSAWAQKGYIYYILRKSTEEAEAPWELASDISAVKGWGYGFVEDTDREMAGWCLLHPPVQGLTLQGLSSQSAN